MFFVIKLRRVALVMAACALLAVAFFAFRAPSPGAQGVVSVKDGTLPIYCVDRGKEKVAAISFDAAWGDERTEGILDILDEHGVRATFFLVGFWVEKYPDKVKLISERGHEIGNHSSNHPHMPQLSDEQMRMEIEDAGAKIQALTGKPVDLFRFPYGDYDDRSIKVVRDLGLYPVQWDVDSLDWMEEGVEAMVKQVVGKVSPGSIILFHNNSRDILQALPIILEQLQAKGYSIVPVSELIYRGEYTVQRSGRQNKPAQ